jgi:hypothetical protein
MDLKILSATFWRIELGLENTMSMVQLMLMQRWNAYEIWLIQMMSESNPFSPLFWHFSLTIVSSEIFNPYPFVLGIKRPDAKLFACITEDLISERENLVPSYAEGLLAVTLFLSKAAPLTDLYHYLRDHPLQNPAKAKVHCEHGFASLRLAVKFYLEVSFYRLASFNLGVDLILKKCTHLVIPKVLRR